MSLTFKLVTVFLDATDDERLYSLELPAMRQFRANCLRRDVEEVTLYKVLTNRGRSIVTRIAHMHNGA